MTVGEFMARVRAAVKDPDARAAQAKVQAICDDAQIFLAREQSTKREEMRVPDLLS